MGWRLGHTLARLSSRQAARCYTPRIRFRAATGAAARTSEELLGELRGILTKGDGSIAGVQQLSNQWFALADKDRSKSIGGEEFRELMDTVGLHLRDNEWKLLFEYFDPKKTGEISYSDFTQTLRGEMPQFAASLAFMDQYRGHYPSNMASLRRVMPRFDPEETDEWIESLDAVLGTHGPTRARFLLHELGDEDMTFRACRLDPVYKGDLELDQEKVESGDSSKGTQHLAAAAQSTASSSAESHEQRSVHAVHNEEQLSQLVANANAVSEKAVSNFSIVDLHLPGAPPSDSLVQGLAKELHGGTTVIMYKLGDGMGSDPNAPKEMTPEEKEEVSKANGGKGDSMLTSAWKHIREIRANSGNVVASVVSVVDPENCLTKLLLAVHKRQRKLQEETSAPPQNVLAWGNVIGACGRTISWREALLLLQRMPGEQVVPNIVCHNAALSACERSRNWTAALALYGSLRSARLSPTVATETTFLSALAQGLCWEAAVRHLSQMQNEGDAKPNVITFSSAIRAAEMGSAWEHVLKLLSDMPGASVKPDTIMMTSCIGASYKAAQWAQAVHLFDCLDSMGLTPDVFCFNNAIAAWASPGHWKTTFTLLQRLRLSKLQPVGDTLTSCISACGQAAQWEAALLLLQDLGTEVRADSFAQVLLACARGAQWPRGLELMEEMARRAVRGDLRTYTAALTVCEGGSLWEQAVRLLSSAPVHASCWGVDASCKEAPAAWLKLKGC
ncbi:PTAC2 [Symbiodinium sp. CCMP2592]|nr:PTAC2 [Symbiodinium sp. CCMP2592]